MRRYQTDSRRRISTGRPVTAFLTEVAGLGFTYHPDGRFEDRRHAGTPMVFGELADDGRLDTDATLRNLTALRTAADYVADCRARVAALGQLISA